MPNGEIDLKGLTPETWACADCGINTAPPQLSRIELEQRLKTAIAMEKLTGQEAHVELRFDARCEVYMVRNSVWKAAGMEPFGGCLCVACLEGRLGRSLKSKDFSRHPFNRLPATERLIERRSNAER
jgi:hypothetical protein